MRSSSLSLIGILGAAFYSLSSCSSIKSENVPFSSSLAVKGEGLTPKDNISVLCTGEASTERDRSNGTKSRYEEGSSSHSISNGFVGSITDNSQDKLKEKAQKHPARSISRRSYEYKFAVGMYDRLCNLGNLGLSKTHLDSYADNQDIYEIVHGTDEAQLNTVARVHERARQASLSTKLTS